MSAVEQSGSEDVRYELTHEDWFMSWLNSCAGCLDSKINAAMGYQDQTPLSLNKDPRSCQDWPLVYTSTGRRYFWNHTKNRLEVEISTAKVGWDCTFTWESLGSVHQAYPPGDTSDPSVQQRKGFKKLLEYVGKTGDEVRKIIEEYPARWTDLAALPQSFFHEILRRHGPAIRYRRLNCKSTTNVILTTEKRETTFVKDLQSRSSAGVRSEVCDRMMKEFMALLPEEYLANAQWSFKFLTGPEITEHYRLDLLRTNSCMTGTANYRFTELYAENPDKVQMVLVFRDDLPVRVKPLFRALLWKDVRGRLWLDRLYPTSVSDCRTIVSRILNGGEAATRRICLALGEKLGQRVFSIRSIKEGVFEGMSSWDAIKLHRPMVVVKLPESMEFPYLDSWDTLYSEKSFRNPGHKPGDFIALGVGGIHSKEDLPEYWEEVRAALDPTGDINLFVGHSPDLEKIRTGSYLRRWGLGPYRWPGSVTYKFDPLWALQVSSGETITDPNTPDWVKETYKDRVNLGANKPPTIKSDVAEFQVLEPAPVLVADHDPEDEDDDAHTWTCDDCEDVLYDDEPRIEAVSYRGRDITICDHCSRGDYYQVPLNGRCEVYYHTDLLEYSEELDGWIDPSGNTDGYVLAHVPDGGRQWVEEGDAVETVCGNYVVHRMVDAVVMEGPGGNIDGYIAGAVDNIPGDCVLMDDDARYDGRRMEVYAAERNVYHSGLLDRWFWDEDELMEAEIEFQQDRAADDEIDERRAAREVA